MVTKKTDIKKPSKTSSLGAPKKKAAQSKERSSHCHNITDKTIDKDLKMKIAELERFASFPRLNPNPVLEVDSSGEILFINIAAKDILRKLNLGEEGDIFLPQDIHTILRGLHHKKEKEFYREVTIQDRVFGETLYLAPEFHAVRIYAHDITERRRAEDALKDTLNESKQRQAEISALLEGSSAVLRYRNFMDAAEAIFKSCKNVVGATSGYIAMVSHDGTKNEVIFLDSGNLLCTVDPGLPMPIRGMRGEVYGSRNTIYHNDFPQSGWAHFLPEGHVQLENVLMSPMIVEKKVVGLFGLGNKLGGFTENDMRIVSAFSEFAAIALIQKRAEDAIRQSEEYFRQLTEKSSDIISILEIDGTIRYTSPSIKSILGYEQEELIGKNAFEFVQPDDLKNVQNTFTRIIQKPNISLSAELRFHHKDGSWRFLEAMGSNLLHNTAISGIIINVRDITERKRAEEALRESEEDLNRAQAVARTGSWRMNVQKNELFWSDENHRIFGIPKGIPLTYETFLSTVYLDDREYVDRKWMAALRGEHYDIEHRIVVKGREKWVRERAELEFDKDGSLLGGFGTTQDITARKLAEGELKKAKDALQEANYRLESKVQERTDELSKAYEVVATERQRLFSVLEEIPAYVCLLTVGYKFAYVNQEFKRRFGNPRDRLCYEFLFDRQKPCEICQTFRVFAEQKPQQWEWTGPDENTYAIFDYPFTDIDGSSMILELGIDITQRKMAEEKLKESREQLRNLYTHLQLAVEAERTKIAREIHDEFGTILTALNIDLSWLGKKLHRDQHTLIERINKDVEFINSAIKVVQRISSELRPGVLDYLGFSSAVEWQVKEFANRTGIDWDISIDMKISDLDKNISIALFRILQESLTNIARYAEASKIKVYLIETDSILTLEVVDDGKGITEEQLSDPHSLGILGMRERIQYLSGDIDIKGIPNKGTTVTVRVPIAKQGYEK